MDMTFQPFDLTDDMIGDYNDDLDNLLSMPTDFSGAIDNFNLGQGDRTLNTPTLPINNPLATLSSGIDSQENDDCSTLMLISSNQDLTISSDNVNEELEFPTSDDRLYDNNTEYNSEQQVNDNDQETIAVITNYQAAIAAIEAIENDLRESVAEHADNLDVQAIITTMTRHGIPRMRMRKQPKKEYRFRYSSEKGSREKPMAIELPNLTGCLTKPHQSFCVQLTIVTTQNNPQQKTFLHVHEIHYKGANVVQIGLQSLRIPLTEDEIYSRTKVFRHISIIKTLLRGYTFELTPFHPLIADDHVEYYTPANGDSLSKVQKAKQFDREYQTDHYRIVCQLMIKQNDRWYTTALYCETHVVTAK